MSVWVSDFSFTVFSAGVFLPLGKIAGAQGGTHFWEGVEYFQRKKNKIIIIRFVEVGEDVYKRQLKSLPPFRPLVFTEVL